MKQRLTSCIPYISTHDIVYDNLYVVFLLFSVCVPAEAEELTSAVLLLFTASIPAGAEELTTAVFSLH